MSIESTKASKIKLISSTFKNEFYENLESVVTDSFNKADQQIEEMLLLKLPKVLTILNNPFRFADFLLKNIDDSETSIEKKILCLNCLVILIGKFSFEFKDFYKKLYKVIQLEYLNEVSEANQGKEKGKFLVSQIIGKGLFNNKYSAKFMKILEISFRSSGLALNVLASFVKVIL